VAPGYILALNVGSSGLKFAAYEAGTMRLLVRGEWRASAGAAIQLRLSAGTGGVAVCTTVPSLLPTGQIRLILDALTPYTETRVLMAVGHRIVHGGRCFSVPVILDNHSISKLEELSPLAPLHQPACLAMVEAVREVMPGLRQVACFDTGFHNALTPPVSRYAVPPELEADGVRRYGFHGISYQSITDQLAADPTFSPDERVVVAHLGSGASLCAMRNLRSVDTTMGFSTLEGIVMGTRPGTLDPGIMLYLMRAKRWSADQIERLLYHECGLKAVSGMTGDVEALLRSTDPRAREALDLFAFSVARHTAAVASTLGGLDRFVFTGGIGEHASPVRAMIGDRLAWLGCELSGEANDDNRREISAADSRIRVQVLETDEQAVIARATAGLVTGPTAMAADASNEHR